MSADRWSAEAEAFVQGFLSRAGSWDAQPGDLIGDEPGPTPRQVDDGWDTITILRARGRRLAKRIMACGTIEAYEGARLFDLIEIPVAGIDMIEEDLARLIRLPDRCIVRGKIAEIGRSRGVRRLLHQEGDYRPTLVDVPRRWLALDIDGIPRPDHIAAGDLVACAGIAIAALPAAFHRARCIVQPTAGHGFKPGMRLRLWFWFARPVSTAELKRWLPASLVDHAVFGAAQPIYTAAPIFDGRRDPLPTRLIRLPASAACVAVPELPEPRPQPQPEPVKREPGLSRYGEVALDNAARRIAAARTGDRDKVLNAECYGIGRLAGAGVIPQSLARRTLLRAAACWPEYAERRDGKKIERSFADGLANPREAANG